MTAHLDMAEATELVILNRERGLLAEGQPIIESTSGSLGVGLAYAGRAMGHPVPRPRRTVSGPLRTETT